MSQDSFQVEQMDNVTLFVSDRYEAAEWLEQVLGLEICPEYEQWAEDEDGPLMVSSDSEDTMVAVCKEQSEQSHETDTDHHISFRVTGEGFLRFLERLQELSLTHADGQEVTRDDTIDFGLSYGIHFHDPYGNQFELTTYEYQTVTTALE